MVEIRINGEQSPVNAGSFRRLADVIELIKSNIDPAHMITVIRMNGNELSESDWQCNPFDMPTCILEIETGAPGNFVKERIRIAVELVRTVYMEFRDARKRFQAGSMEDGNRSLICAVNDLKAFLSWYLSLIDLVPEPKKARYSIQSQIESLTDICKRICQQQLYQSWWALGESLERELEPELDKLESFFIKMSEDSAAAF